MRAVVTLVGLIATVAAALTYAPQVQASSGWGLEDPQLCVNRQLLSVYPAHPADVSVTVPKGATVDLTSCPIDPNGETIDPSSVVTSGGNKIKVTVQAPSGVTETYTWGLVTITDVAKHGQSSAKFSTK